MTFNLQFYILFVLLTSVFFNIFQFKENTPLKKIYLVLISLYIIFSISSATFINLSIFLIILLGVYFLRSYRFIIKLAKLFLIFFTSFLYIKNFEISLLSDLVPLLGYSFLFVRSFWLINYIEKSKINNFYLIDFILYIFYFPIISAGPVEKPDFMNTNSFVVSYESFLEGIGRISIGTIFVLVFQENISNINNIPLFLIPFRTLLILFFNFSGYTHIAIGTSLLFGIRLTENFNKPWLALDFSDFWKRWHISLMNFANENVFFPFFKTFKGNQNLAIFCTLICVGLWHDFTLAFLAWGLMQGIFFPISIKIRKNIESLGLPKIISNNFLRLFVLYLQALISHFSLVVIKI